MFLIRTMGNDKYTWGYITQQNNYYLTTQEQATQYKNEETAKRVMIDVIEQFSRWGFHWQFEIFKIS